MCNDPLVKKCDCIIFRFGSLNDKPVMFVIEVKGRHPDLHEVKEQIEYCIEEMLNFLPNPKNRFQIIPVLYARRITSFLKHVAFSNRIKIFGSKVLILMRRYGQDLNELT